MRPVPNDAPTWLAPFLQELLDAVNELTIPTYPHPVLRLTVAQLPPVASAEPGSVVDLSDLNTLGKSDGVNWRRVDTGAIVA